MAIPRPAFAFACANSIGLRIAVAVGTAWHDGDASPLYMLSCGMWEHWTAARIDEMIGDIAWLLALYADPSERKRYDMRPDDAEAFYRARCELSFLRALAASYEEDRTI
jgi:hypothetical protein